MGTQLEVAWTYVSWQLFVAAGSFINTFLPSNLWNNAFNISKKSHYRFFLLVEVNSSAVEHLFFNCYLIPDKYNFLCLADLLSHPFVLFFYSDSFFTPQKLEISSLYWWCRLNLDTQIWIFSLNMKSLNYFTAVLGNTICLSSAVYCRITIFRQLTTHN